MNKYELVLDNGTGTDFEAKNLREAKKIAKEIKGDYEGWGQVYEGYTPKGKI